MKEAILLAGGLGTRLRGVIGEIPKCMALVAGQPFLHHLLRYVIGQGVSRVVLSLGYKSEIVIHWINEQRLPIEIDWVIEEQPLGTGGGIRLALQACNAAHVAVLNGDTMFQIDLATMTAAHLAQGAETTLALKPMRDFERYGTVATDSHGCITAFQEKAPTAAGRINGGMYLVDRAAFLQRPLPTQFSFEKDYLERFLSERRFYGYDRGAYFIDIGVPQDYEQAQHDFLNAIFAGMKIGIIGPAWPLRGGLADFDERFARELQSLGYDVIIYSYSLQYPKALFPGKTQITDAPAPAGLRIIPLINSVNPLNWISSAARINRDAPELLVVRYWLPFMGPALGAILRRVGKGKRTQIIAIADNILPHEKRPGDLAFTKYFIKPVHRFVTMSEEVMTDLRSLTSKPAIRLQHPLYDNYGAGIPRGDALRHLQLPAGQKYLLFFGFIRKYKGLDILLEAMADKRLAVAGIHLIIAGEYYGDRDFYEGIIARHNLNDRVRRFADFIPNDDVKYYFSATDCVALPYRSATQSGITQVAYHFERGMVATNVGGLPEIVKDGITGIVCEPQPEALADAILAYFTPGGIPHLAANLQAERQLHSWKAFAEALLGFAAAG